MVQKVNCDAKVIIGGKAGGMLRGMGKMLAHEAVISGYGAISDTDIGVVATNTYDFLETARSFQAPALAQEAKHSAFAVFRDAIAEAAENPMSYGTTVKNVANGQNYTNFYSDLLAGQRMIEGDLLTADADSLEAKLDYSSVDWNDADARDAYLKNIQSYASQTGLRDHAGFVDGRAGSSSDELKILLHTNSREEYTKYIQQFESAIQENFTTALNNAQEQAKTLGYTGSMTDVKAMEKFAATLGGADKAAMENLIRLTDGKINKVDQFILARIAEGHINLDETLAGVRGPDGIKRHFLNGVEIDQKALHALAALNVYAHSDAIASAYTTQALTAIGGSTELAEVDLNNIRHVSVRCKEFEDALTKQGFGAWQTKGGKFQLAVDPNKRGKIKGIGLEHMSMKQLRTIDLSKIENKDVRKALQQYINLREHKETLMSAKELMGNMQMRITQLARKILGDSDLSQAIGQIQSQYRNVQFAMKMWVKIGKFANWVGQKSLQRALRKDARLAKKWGENSQKFQDYIKSRRSGASRQARYDSRVEKRKTAKKARGEKAKAKKKTKIEKLKGSKKGQRRLARSAKKAEKKLLSKAGKQGSNLVRRAGHLAKHGALGTTAGAGGTGAAAAGAGGGAAAAGAGGGAAAAGGGAGGAAAGAGGAAGGASLGVVLIWIIVIAIIVAAVCTLISGIINVIISAATEFDNTLIGKMANWIANFKWPWEATDEDKQNVLWYTMYKLQEEDISAKQVGNVLGESQFHGGMIACTKALAEGGTAGYNSDRTLSTYWDQEHYGASNLGSAPVYYMYTNGITGDPINEYSSIKLCLSMAHAYTYQIETKKHIENFTTYAIGLWKHLNKTEVRAVLTMCPGCYNYDYDCEIKWICGKDKADHGANCGCKGSSWDSTFYSRVYLNNTDTYTAPGAKFTISPDMNYGTSAKLYIVTSGLNHAAMNKTTHGCITLTHDNRTGKYKKDDTKNLGNGTSGWVSAASGQAGKLSALNTSFAANMNNENIGIKRTTTVDSYLDSSGAKLTWYADPYGLKDCFNRQTGANYINGDFSSKGSGILSEKLNSYHFEFCTQSTSTITGCNNQTTLTKYKNDPIWSYHGTKYTGANSIADGNKCNNTWGLCDKSYQDGHSHTYKTLYTCKGHSTEKPCYCGYTEYEYTYTQKTVSGKKVWVATYVGTIENVVADNYSDSRVCSQCTSKTVWLYEGTNLSSKPSKTTIYVCGGHTNHGTFTSDSEYYWSCIDWKWIEPVKDKDGKITREGYWKDNGDGYTKKGNYYICTGYNKDNYVANGTVNVCLGHLKCTSNTLHQYCPGHDFKYCKGHIEYQVERRTTLDSSDSIYSDSWTYTVKATYLWFIEVETVYSPKKDTSHTSLARKDWAGWHEDNVDLMMTMYLSDWYIKYGIGLGTFVGGECSQGEKSAIMDNYNINANTTTDILMANLDFALDACGKVCYYPNGKAVAAGMDASNKFNKPTTAVFDKNNIKRAVGGLDPRYFADWVYRSTHDNSSTAYLTSSITSNTYSVDQWTKAGMPIVNFSDPNNIRSGILIGTYQEDGTGTRYIVYVGIDTGSKTGGGWVTVIKEPISGWKYSTAVQT